MPNPNNLRALLAADGRSHGGQTWLARELSAQLGENIDRSQVNGWVAGRTPAPYRRAAVARVLGRTQAEVFPCEPPHEADALDQAA